MNLPTDFIERMKKQMGAEAELFLDSYDKISVSGLRINPLKCDRRKFLEDNPFDLEPVPWTSSGFRYDGLQRPGKHVWHEAGLYYIQEPSAMAAAVQVAPLPGERVLDLCAAPGGKTTQLAAMMENRGLLVSNEIHPVRAKALSQNVERLGIVNTVVTNEPPDKLASHFPYFFDRILVDAPCSGEGMFRKDPETCSEWSMENVEMCRERQLVILGQIKDCLRPGGRLVYSTCTFSTEENEQVIRRFLAENPDFEAEQPEGCALFESSMPGTLRLWPHRLQGEGHFIAVLHRKEVGQEDSRYGRKIRTQQGLQSKGMLKDYFDFVEKNLADGWNTDGTLVLFGDHLYSIPKEMVSMEKLKVVRPGLHLGEIKKNRFEPSHALALALTAEQARQTNPLQSGSPQVEAYLKGQALQGSGQKNGWVLVTVDGYSLGWTKAADGLMKNHYPKGLRWK